MTNVKSALAEVISERLALVRQRVMDAGGDQVEILAVSKGHDVDAAIAAASIGASSLGENYAQELAAKAEVLRDHALDVDWHFVGNLQTNKVRQIAAHVHTWQSVDRLKVGREIAKRAPGARVFVQVNLAGESHKGGCRFDEVNQLVSDLADLDLDVCGLMGVGTAGDQRETAASFERLRSHVDQLGLAQCSMGMSADLELAIAAGSTMVRVGTDIFGPRPPR